MSEDEEVNTEYANDRDPQREMFSVAQVGGNHYGVGYGHWDWVIECKLGYLEGCATKYIMRWEHKGDPINDVEKAKSFVEKIMMNYKHGMYKPTHKYNEEAFERFCGACHVTGMERNICEAISKWKNIADLITIIDTIDILIKTARDAVRAGDLVVGAKPIVNR